MKNDAELANHVKGKRHVSMAAGAKDWYVIKPLAEYDNW
jgi:hypothetical protein